MLIDLRRYVIAPGQLKTYLAVYEAHGLPVQRRHIGEPLGYFTTEVGTLNQVVHLWGYQNAEDRQVRRAAMEADPDWTAYKKITAEGRYIQQQKNELLVSAPWSKM